MELQLMKFIKFNKFININPESDIEVLGVQQLRLICSVFLLGVLLI